MKFENFLVHLFVNSLGCSLVNAMQYFFKVLLIYTSSIQLFVIFSSSDAYSLVSIGLGKLHLILFPLIGVVENFDRR